MKSLIRVIAVSAVAATFGVRADDFDDSFFDSEESSGETGEESGGLDGSGEDAGEEAGEEADGDDEIGDIKRIQERIFYLLPCCSGIEGSVEVMLPGGEWRAAEENRRYALGARYRTVGADARLTLKFGPEAEVIVKGDASFTTRAQRLDEKVRSIGLSSGTLTVKLSDQMPTNSFSVTAPGFTIVNPAGESRYTYSRLPDGDEAIVRCVTKTLSVQGRHFSVASMRAANEIRIRTSQDLLLTALYGSRGDVMVKLDQGKVQTKDFGTGETKIEAKFLDWKLSPLTSVRIHRAQPALGRNMAVTVMTFNANSELKNRCAFAEDTPEVNSGELGPTSKKEREELAKRAAEAAAAMAAEGTDAEAEDVDEAEDSGSGDEDDDIDDDLF